MTVNQRCLITSLLFLCCLTPVYGSDIGYFRIKLEPHYLPADSQGVSRGIVDDLVSDIFDESGYRIVPIQLPQRRRDLSLNSRSDSVWITISSQYIFTHFRQYFPETAKASVPWHDFECIVISPKDKPLDLSNVDHSRLGFIYMPKPFWDEVLTSNKYHYELVPSTQSGLKMLLLGRINAMFSFNTIINWNLKAIDRKSSDFHIQRCPFWKDDQLIFIINEDKAGAIKKLMNKRIDSFKKNGLIDEIVHRYTPKF